MKSIVIAFFACVLAPSATAAQPATHEGTSGEGMVNPGYQDKPDWFKASFLDIREDIDEAGTAGKRNVMRWISPESVSLAAGSGGIMPVIHSAAHVEVEYGIWIVT